MPFWRRRKGVHRYEEVERDTVCRIEGREK